MMLKRPTGRVPWRGYDYGTSNGACRTHRGPGKFFQLSALAGGLEGLRNRRRSQVCRPGGIRRGGDAGSATSAEAPAGTSTVNSMVGPVRCHDTLTSPRGVGYRPRAHSRPQGGVRRGTRRSLERSGTGPALRARGRTHAWPTRRVSGSRCRASAPRTCQGRRHRAWGPALADVVDDVLLTAGGGERARAGLTLPSSCAVERGYHTTGRAATDRRRCWRRRRMG